MKQFDVFCIRCRRHEGHAGDVSARTSQAGNDAGLYGVGRDGYDRDILCCLLGRQCVRHVKRHDQIDFESDKFGREFWKLVSLSFGGAKLERDVLSLDISEFTQSFAKVCLEGIRVRVSQVKCAYPGNSRLLAKRGQRP
jgi:hypothetical protein